MIDKDNFADFGRAAGRAAAGLGLGLVSTWIAHKLFINELGGLIVGSFRDKVLEPEIGSIVCCDYIGFQHTGIYVGNGFIVSLKDTGVVTKEHAYDFKKGKNAINIYVSCNGKKPVGNKKCAERAMKKLHEKIGYDLLSNNCHHFCSGCLTGRFENGDVLFAHLVRRAESKLGCNHKLGT